MAGHCPLKYVACFLPCAVGMLGPKIQEIVLSLSLKLHDFTQSCRKLRSIAINSCYQEGFRVFNLDLVITFILVEENMAAVFFHEKSR